METIVDKRSSTLAMHKQSHTISKSKPKIRIIHIFAPEIIKTDVENFRELVQRLTGKPDDDDHHRLHNLQDRQKVFKKNPSRDHHQVHNMIKKSPALPTKKTEPENVFCTNFEVEEEGEMTWTDNDKSSGCFLSSLGDLDGFIQELGELPYLPLAMDAAAASSSSSSSHIHGGFA